MAKAGGIVNEIADPTLQDVYDLLVKMEASLDATAAEIGVLRATLQKAADL